MTGSSILAGAMRFALLTVSYSGLFYDGPALSVEQQVHKARELGFDGLSIEAKRPIASPLDLSEADRNRIKHVAQSAGIELCAVESMSNFTSRFMEERESNLAMMREVIRLAADLGVERVKIFAAWPGLVNDEREGAFYGTYERGRCYTRPYPADLRRWNRAVEESAKWPAGLRTRGLRWLCKTTLP